MGGVELKRGITITLSRRELEVIFDSLHFTQCDKFHDPLGETTQLLKHFSKVVPTYWTKWVNGGMV
jgi:hypothetical protein